MRIGHGYDVHRLVSGRKLILGGMDIPYDRGLDGHSDADVLTHAIMDALLGAAAMGDIGQHFPDNDDTFLGIDSQILLKKVCTLLREHQYDIGNLDATIIAQKPKLMPYLERMRETLAHTMEIPMSKINLKATTEERLGFTGREEGISAHCVCLLEERCNCGTTM